MIKKLFFYLILVSLFSNVASAQTAETAAFDQLLQTEYNTPQGPGAVLLVSRKGQIIYHKATGMAQVELGVPLRTDHIFRIGSVTKQFTAAAILQLAEQGKLSLQDELTRFIPDYPVQGQKITVEHLLNHTSGIKSYTGMMDKFNPQTMRKDQTLTELIDWFKNEPMDFPAGTEWKYNNSGYILLGYIIEKASGQSYADYLNEHIFKPLGLKNTRYDDTKAIIPQRAQGYTRPDDSGAFENAAYLSMSLPHAAGSLLSTVEDLMVWTRALHGGKVIRPESLRKMLTPYILPKGVNTHYGYGISAGQLLGAATYEHSGGINGFLSNLIYLPAEDICVAALTNCDCRPPSGMTDKAAAIAAGKQIKPAAVQADAKTLAEYVGVYENAQKESRVIRLENGKLTSQRTGGGKNDITPFGPDQFFFETTIARIAFVRENGKVVKALISDRKDNNAVWIKTDKPLPSDRAAVSLTEAQLKPFIGEYELAPGFSITVTNEGNRLFAQATGQERFEIFPASPTRFFVKVVEADIEFYPDDKGLVNKMVLFQGGQEMPGKRVK